MISRIEEKLKAIREAVIALRHGYTENADIALTILTELKAELKPKEIDVDKVAKAIIIARDGKRDGERRYNKDKTIRKAYQNDAKVAIAEIERQQNER